MWLNPFDQVYVRLNSLIKVEWHGYYPVLVVHEKFEKKIKWVLWIITIAGIATSVLTIDKWYYALALSVLIFLVGQFFARTLFEYTTFVFRPLPPFDLDKTQWQTNGFMIPREEFKRAEDLAYVGPSFKDKEFAAKLFSYLMTWNKNGNLDKDNNIILSFVIEPNEWYSTYIYSSTSGKDIEQSFIREAEKKKLEKYGKRQQQFVAQHVFWHTLPFKEGYLIKRFLAYQKQDAPFYFTPSVVGPTDQQPEFLFDYSILKYNYKLKKREELREEEIEYHMKPTN